jgi:hypothetical protein
MTPKLVQRAISRLGYLRKGIVLAEEKQVPVKKIDGEHLEKTLRGFD